MLYMIARPRSTHLRLAAALVHSAEGVDLELWQGTDRLVVSHRSDRHADLSPCELRRLVLAATADGPDAGFVDWVRRLDALAVTGSGVTPSSGGVWRVDRDGVGSWVWATTLPGSLVPLAVADAAAGLLADGEADAAVVECCGAAVKLDDQLGASVVSIEEPCSEISDQVGRLAQGLAARLRVEELLHDAERTIRNGPAGL
jgi:hypothetical protein